MRFKKIYIEITNTCNLSCSFCPKTSRELHYMGTQLFIKILEELQGYTKYLYFHVLGEPLLHPNLKSFIGLSYQKGYQVNLTTNGTLIGPNLYGTLFQEGLRQINISLHSWEEQRSLEGLDQYLESVFEFIRQARVNHTKLYINLRLWNIGTTPSPATNYTLHKLQHFFSLGYPLSITELKAGKSLTLAENVFLSSDVEFVWPSIQGEVFGTTGYCYGLKNQLAVLVDGTVVPCCLDGEGSIKLGNITNTPLDVILAADRAQAILGGFSQRKITEPLCQRCGFRTRFN